MCEFRDSLPVSVVGCNGAPDNLLWILGVNPGSGYQDRQNQSVHSEQPPTTLLQKGVQTDKPCACSHLRRFGDAEHEKKLLGQQLVKLCFDLRKALRAAQDVLN